MMVDERTELKFSDFFVTKNGMVEPTCEQLHRWKQSGHGVKYIRMDNAGENKLLQQRTESKDWKLDITYEYTARDTPQQNHLVELGFAIIANRGRALLRHANVPVKDRYRLYTKAFQTATQLDGLTVTEIDGVKDTRYKHWCGENPKFVNHLRTWGEAGTVKLRTRATTKVEDRGKPCMFVGYSKGHHGDCYEMWDPDTHMVHQSRDVIWLKRMFFERAITQDNIVVAPIIDDNLKVDGAAAGESGDDPPLDDILPAEQTVTEVPAVARDDRTTRSGRVITAPTLLMHETTAAAQDYEIKLTTAEHNYYQAISQLGEYALIGAGIGGGFDDTS
jgi:hypothetical protein